METVKVCVCVRAFRCGFTVSCLRAAGGRMTRWLCLCAGMNEARGSRALVSMVTGIAALCVFAVGWGAWPQVFGARWQLLIKAGVRWLNLTRACVRPLLASQRLSCLPLTLVCYSATNGAGFSVCPPVESVKCGECTSAERWNDELQGDFFSLSLMQQNNWIIFLDEHVLEFQISRKF